MRASLRRSCDGCAKAKHACDLQTPRCSRCVKKQVTCVYANQPLTSSSSKSSSPSSLSAPSSSTPSSTSSPRNSSPKSEVPPLELDDDAAGALVPVSSTRPMYYDYGNSVALPRSANTSFDPFDSYPPTRLPRTHAQRLIHHFLSNIAFQYYPLDLGMSSNPFVVSWWPLALADPALFHVSLQTASLDEELRLQKGFSTSELLMADSVALVRRKIETPELACRDETLNAVVTLAAIEHGKGNITASKMHIEGIKEMVALRGGIDQVKQTSPLTARMVSWVSLIVTCLPQFQLEDASASGRGISPIPQWYTAPAMDDEEAPLLDAVHLDPAIIDVLARVRRVLSLELTDMELHDLTCFVLHKLLFLPALKATDATATAISECLRYAAALFMLLIHGTTYYSHHELLAVLLLQLKTNLEQILGTSSVYSAAGIWILTVGMAASSSGLNFGAVKSQWFADQAYVAKTALGIRTWDDVLANLDKVLWAKTWHEGVAVMKSAWDEIL